MPSLEDLQRFVAEHADVCDFGQPATPELIEAAERYLGVRLPDDYRALLRRWGKLAIGPLEIYGLCNDDFENSSVPDAIWFTQTQRDALGLPADLVVVADNDGDEYFCLRTIEPADSRVLIWDTHTRQLRGQRGDSLFDFVLNEVADVL